MNNVKYFLKFGKKKYLESFAEGELFFSNAVTFWKIEDDFRIKGQGDILEAGAKIFAQKIAIRDQNSHICLEQKGDIFGILRSEKAKYTPVLCLFSVYEEDCIQTNDGKSEIRLSEGKKQTICEHFPEADAVCVIPNPEEFIADVKNSIGAKAKMGEVRYFNIDKGFVSSDGKRVNDGQFVNYIMRQEKVDSPCEKIVFMPREDIEERILFSKDLFFKNEQEFRIILPEEQIREGKKYSVKFQNRYEIVELEKFFGYASE